MMCHYPDMGTASTNQKHYPDLGSDTSSAWNFCARLSDVISQETIGGVTKCRLFSQASITSRLRILSRN